MKNHLKKISGIQAVEETTRKYLKNGRLPSQCTTRRFVIDRVDGTKANDRTRSRIMGSSKNRCFGRLKMFAVLIGLCNEVWGLAAASGH